MKRNYFLFFLCISILLSSCSNEEDNIVNLPNPSKLISKRFNSDGSLNSIIEYNYTYQNGLMESIDIKAEYTDRPDRNKDYTITKFFNGDKNTYDIHNYRLTPENSTFITRVDYNYENDLISSQVLTRSDDATFEDFYTYNEQKLLNEKFNDDRKYTYEYQSGRMIKEIYSYTFDGEVYENITEYKYINVLNPFYQSATSSIIKVNNLTKNIRIFSNETVETETNELNLPTKLTISRDGVVGQIRTYEY
jgi:hypothetical protein